MAAGRAAPERGFLAGGCPPPAAAKLHQQSGKVASKRYALTGKRTVIEPLSKRKSEAMRAQLNMYRPLVRPPPQPPRCQKNSKDSDSPDGH